jgi:transcriptional regulator with XRE-family HTH domain
MDRVRLGRQVRALRRRRGWRQVDLARAANVSASTVWRIESGRGGVVTLDVADRVAQALGARLEIRLSWNGEALDRLLDADHASLVERALASLGAMGWEAVPEVSFGINGERGSVDVLARHPAAPVILVVEVKSVVPDVQATLVTLDRKRRLALSIARLRGWPGSAVATILLLAEGRTSRRRVEEHAATFAAQLPDRGALVRGWLASPTAARPVRGILFVPVGRGARARQRVVKSSRRGSWAGFERHPRAC